MIDDHRSIDTTIDRWSVIGNKKYYQGMVYVLVETVFVKKIFSHTRSETDTD